MQNVIAGLLLASCALPIFAGSMTIASSLSSKPDIHRFANLDAEPLWTSDIKRIDVQEQAYERLPSLVAPDALLAEAQKPVKPNKAVPGAASEDENNKAELASAQAHELAQQWCAERYRSYSPEDNTYQPYGGGARRACVAPVQEAAPSIIEAAGDTMQALDDGHIRSCMQRYSSYRIEDNSYQPFSGPRKKCASSGEQSASNRYGLMAQEQY